MWSHPSGIDGPRGLLRVLEVALEDVRAAGEDLAVLVELDLDAGQRLAHRSHQGTARAVHGDDPGGLGHPVALHQRDAQHLEEAEELGRGRCGAAQGEPGPVEADAPLEGLADRPVGEEAGGPEPGGDLPGGGRLHPASPHRHGQPVEAALQEGGVGHPQLDGGGELLPDARHAGEVGGRDLAQVLEERVQALHEVDDVAHSQVEEHRAEVLVDVRQRQVGDELVVHPGAVREDERLRHEERAAVGEHGALGISGGPRGVDDHRRVLRRDLGEPLLDAMRIGGPQRLPFLLEILVEDHPGIPEAPQALGIPDHHPLHPGLRQDGKHLLQLLLVLEEEEARLGVVEDVEDLLGRGGRVDAAGGSAGGHDPQRGVEPLRPVLAQDRHVLLVAEAEGHQAGRHLADALRVLAPGDAVPDPQRLVAQRDGAAAATGLVEEHSRKASDGGHQRLFFR